MDDTPIMAVQPVLDCEQIDGLIVVAGVDGAKSILEAFWRSTNKLMVQLQDQLAAGEIGEAAKTAHALKGSALNVGALHLSSTVRRIEDACRRSDLQDAVARVSVAKESCDETFKAFEAHLAA